MSFFFLHPIYLYGLLAASLPILIHLLNRRRIKRIRFPAVRFILLSQRRISRTYRLRHWFLLALRTLAVAFLVLLLANPIFQTGLGLFASGGSSSVAIVLDNSLSMKWSMDGKGFDAAKESVRRFIAALNEGDRAALIPTNPAPDTQTRMRGEKELLLKELNQIPRADGTADFSAALQKAYDLLREPAPQKEIWIITDLAVTGWDRFAVGALQSYDTLIPLKILKVRPSADAVNATIKEIELKSPGVAVGLPLQLETRLVNFTKQPVKDVLVQLNLDGRNVEQRLVSLPPDGETGVAFQVNLTKPGSQPGFVALKKDGLAGNPTGHFVLSAQDKLKVLLVDGDPQTSLIQSETFFLTRSLNPVGSEESSLFLPTVIVPEGLASARLEAYQVVVFCNVPVIPDAVARRITDYLRQGGGVLFFLGNRVDKDDYNLKLFQNSAILPARLIDRKTTDTKGEKIAKIDSNHPALRSLADPISLASLQSVTVQGYFRGEVPSGSTLLSLANGDPLAVEKRIGPGKVILFTTTADRDWTDLPIKTAYLPLVQALVRYLSGNKTGAFDAGIVTGETKTITLPPSFVGKQIRLIKPDNKEREVAVAAQGDSAAAKFTENNLAGIYRVAFPPLAEKPAGAAEMYAVNPPYLESRLDTLSEKDLETKLSPIRAQVIPLEAVENGGKRFDLSLPLAVLLIGTLAAEGWLAQRFSAQ